MGDNIVISDGAKKVLSGYSDISGKDIPVVFEKPGFINLVFIRNTPVLEEELLKAKISFNYIIGPDNMVVVTPDHKTNGSFHSGKETTKCNSTLDAINIAIVTYDPKDVHKQFRRLRELLGELKEKWKIKILKMNHNIQFCNYFHHIGPEKKYWMFFDLKDPYIVDVTMRYLFTDRELVIP